MCLFFNVLLISFSLLAAYYGVSLLIVCYHYELKKDILFIGALSFFLPFLYFFLNVIWLFNDADALFKDSHGDFIFWTWNMFEFTTMIFFVYNSKHLLKSTIPE